MTSPAKIDVWNRALDKIGENAGVESEDDDTPAAEACSRHYGTCLREVFSARRWAWAVRQRAITEVSEVTVTYDGDDVAREFVIPAPYLDTTQIEVVRIDDGEGGLETVFVGGTDYTITPAEGGASATVYLVAGELFATMHLRITVTTSRVGWEHLYSLPSDFVSAVALLDEDMRLSLLPHESRARFAILPDDAGEGLLLATDLDDDDFDTLEYIAQLEYVPLWPAKFEEAVAWRLAAELALVLRKDVQAADYCYARCEKAIDAASAEANNMGNDEATPPTTPSIMDRG